MEFDLPKGCPFIVRKLQVCSTLSSYYLIRERDQYKQYPNIFAKVCQLHEESSNFLVFLSDTGVGTDVFSDLPACEQSVNNPDDTESDYVNSNQQKLSRWNFATVMSYTINPHHRYPYMVLTTHCHFDHILGIRSLLQANTQVIVLSSDHQKKYLAPWRNLQEHSLCNLFNLRAPIYSINWVGHGVRLKYKTSNSSLTEAETDVGITVFHTPGHTPDSIAWYDHDMNILSVGDTLYERESEETKVGSGKWSREPPQPVILVHDSNLQDWMRSIDMLIEFVSNENHMRAKDLSLRNENNSTSQDGYGTLIYGHVDEISLPSDCGGDWLMLANDNIASQGVKLSAAHVTVCTDALTALVEMKRFMMRVIDGKVPKKRVDSFDERDEVWLWDDCIDHGKGEAFLGLNVSKHCRFSVQAPISVIEAAKGALNQDQREYDGDSESLHRTGRFDECICQSDSRPVAYPGQPPSVNFQQKMRDFSMSLYKPTKRI